MSLSEPDTPNAGGDCRTLASQEVGVPLRFTTAERADWDTRNAALEALILQQQRHLGYYQAAWQCPDCGTVEEYGEDKAWVCLRCQVWMQKIPQEKGTLLVPRVQGDECAEESQPSNGLNRESHA